MPQRSFLKKEAVMSKAVFATVNCKKLYASTSESLAAVAPNVPMGLLASYMASRRAG